MLPAKKIKEREQKLLDIQDDVLKGGICVQDWTTFQLENAYISYIAGASLACVVMCQASIESFIRDDEHLDNRSFYDLIEASSYDETTKQKLHKLRSYRNSWAHVDNEKQINYAELDEIALFAYRLAMEIFHYYPFV
ncbi:MAG: hypothetical protein IKC19_09165 [Bacteroidales bacterium]|nr:hypothetical protein [Bacteroidales bacterium]